MSVDVLDQILRRLDVMDRERDVAREESRARHGEVVRSIDALTDRVNTQNGRVGKLELENNGHGAVLREMTSAMVKLGDRFDETTRDVGRLQLWRAGLDAVARGRSWRFPAMVGLASSTVGGVAVAVFIKVVL